MEPTFGSIFVSLSMSIFMQSFSPFPSILKPHYHISYQVILKSTSSMDLPSNSKLIKASWDLFVRACLDRYFILLFLLRKRNTKITDLTAT